MRIDPAGWPFVLGAAILAVLLFWAGFAWAAALAALAGAFGLFFFRDPERRVQAGAGDVLSPADGRVMVAGPPEPGVAPPGTWQQISIFLSPIDVHVNRLPVSGRITRVEYRPGRFLPAYRSDAAAENERNEIWIDHDGQTIVCRQVVGILARRVVCRVKPGAQVEAGDRFGIMKFGSRTDVFVPVDAALRVRVNDRVRAGVTVLATLAQRTR
ncbi:MAG TPA: phosphatidylserine decarboxylase [Vicinamibacterales bacterium]|nr:phosphatidylserine decarboxylase [Vicinamibacterales bacterium]